MSVDFGFSTITLEQLRSTDVFGFSVTRKEVESKDFRRITGIFAIMTLAKREAKRKMLLTFSGYDDMKEEIFEIQEIREYVKQLFYKYPHMFYFISMLENNDKLILACLSDVTSVVMGEKKSLNDIFFDGEMEKRASIGMDIKPPFGVKTPIINKTMEYGLSVGESKEDMNVMIKQILTAEGREVANSPRFSQDTDIVAMYSIINKDLWIGFMNHLGIKKVINDNEIKDYIKGKVNYISTFIKHGIVSAPIMESEKGTTNLFLVNDVAYGSVCEKCGKSLAVIIKKDFKCDDDTLNNCVFVPSPEYFIANRIMPLDEKYVDNLPIPINPKQDMWYCPICEEIHSFTYDSEIGLCY